MKLREQLDLLKGKKIKVGMATSFFYCGACDDNIHDIVAKHSNEELKRIKTINDNSINLVNNFDKIWEEKIAFRVSRRKNGQIKRVEEDIKNDFEPLKKRKGYRLTEAEKLLKEQELEKRLSSLKEEHQKEIEELVEKLNSKKTKVFEKMKNTIVRYKEKIKTFIPFGDRDVIETYDSILEDNTIIIKCEGDENFNYWDEKEYILGEIKKENSKNTLVFKWFNFDGFVKETTKAETLKQRSCISTPKLMINGAEFTIMMIWDGKEYNCYIARPFSTGIRMLNKEDFNFLEENKEELFEKCKNHICE